MLSLGLFCVLIFYSDVTSGMPAVQSNSLDSSVGTSESDVPAFILTTVKHYLKDLPFFEGSKTDEDYSVQELVLLSWEAPDYIDKNFPYYLSGHDEDGKPVWVLKVGKFDFKSLVNKGEAMITDFEKAFVQAILRVLGSMQDIERGDVRKVQLILDFEDFDEEQLASAKGIKLVQGLHNQFRVLLRTMIDRVYAVNVNIAAELTMEALFGIKQGGPFEIYRSEDKSRWISDSAKLFPSLPVLGRDMTGTRTPVASFG